MSRCAGLKLEVAELSIFVNSFLFILLEWIVLSFFMHSLQVKGFEFIKGVHLDPQPFDVERDLATPTYKLKRPQLLKYYQVMHSSVFSRLFCALPEW